MIDSFESLIAIWIKQSRINLYREYQWYPKWTCFDLYNRSDEINEAAIMYVRTSIEHVESNIIPNNVWPKSKQPKSIENYEITCCKVKYHQIVIWTNYFRCFKNDYINWDKRGPQTYLVNYKHNLAAREIRERQYSNISSLNFLSQNNNFGSSDMFNQYGRGVGFHLCPLKRKKHFHLIAASVTRSRQIVV